MSTRSRSLIDPFNEKVRARIFGFTCEIEHDNDINDAVSSPSSSSSSSTYSADRDSPPSLSYLVNAFLETAAAENDGDSEVEADSMESASDPSDLIHEVVNPIIRSNSDRFRADLASHVARAAEVFSLLRRNPAAFNRNVMSYLREIGYDCGVCKTNWEAVPGGGLISGSYEFIDVVRDGSASRYVVDLYFGAQFEVARGTERFECVIGALPRVFVGKCGDLRRIVRVMADELRRSMKVSEMSLPPWRKYRYMQAKWFGPYRRTVDRRNSSAVTSGGAVKCRSVGFFGSAVDGGRLVVAPPSTRTR